MEATSDYWKPVYFLLEREGLDCLLYQASQVEGAVPRAAEDRPAGLRLWLAQDHRAGVAGGQLRAAGGHPAGSAPPHPLPGRRLIQARTAEKARCEKLVVDERGGRAARRGMCGCGFGQGAGWPGAGSGGGGGGAGLAGAAVVH